MGASKNLEWMAHCFIFHVNEARPREDTGRRRAKAARATERTKYPTGEQRSAAGKGSVDLRGRSEETMPPEGDHSRYTSVVTLKFINHLRPSFTFLPRWDLPYGRPSAVWRTPCMFRPRKIGTKTLA